MARNPIRSTVKSFTREQWAAMDARTLQEKAASAKRKVDHKSKANPAVKVKA